MNLFFYFMVFLLGLVVGSFLNCVIYRLETQKSFFGGRSFCPHCHHVLVWQDLIPVFSFLLLGGRCRYCQKPISWQYPLVEIFTGMIFLLIITTASYVYAGIYLLIMAGFLIVIFVYDLKHYVIPDKIVYPAIAAAFLYQSLVIWNFGHWNLFKIWDLGLGVLPSIFFLAIILFSRGQWMGFGDFNLAVLMGLILGWPKIIPALFFAFFTGAIIGLVLVILGRKTLKAEVPFGPFLVAGTFFALFWGEKIINLYISLL
jgi:prepilin signal peptidase PulO-like enzyme (type II secretory pathway)